MNLLSLKKHDLLLVGKSMPIETEEGEVSVEFDTDTEVIKSWRSI
jgi:hypothetical protein